SCSYHPGEPYFHDAKKIWTCCKKSSTDFSDFLNIKGCTRGPHNNIKTKPDEIKAKRDFEMGDNSHTANLANRLSSLLSGQVAPSELPRPKPMARPDHDEEMVKLNVIVTEGLKTALKVLEETKLDQTNLKSGDVSGGSNSGTFCISYLFERHLCK
ncbi:unnamed protein product, partial [Protopolystoma xenopodis]